MIPSMPFVNAPQGIFTHKPNTGYASSVHTGVVSQQLALTGYCTGYDALTATPTPPPLEGIYYFKNAFAGSIDTAKTANKVSLVGFTANIYDNWKEKTTVIGDWEAIL